MLAYISILVFLRSIGRFSSVISFLVRDGLQQFIQRNFSPGSRRMALHCLHYLLWQNRNSQAFVNRPYQSLGADALHYWFRLKPAAMPLLKLLCGMLSFSAFTAGGVSHPANIQIGVQCHDFLRRSGDRDRCGTQMIPSKKETRKVSLFVSIGSPLRMNQRGMKSCCYPELRSLKKPGLPADIFFAALQSAEIRASRHPGIPDNRSSCPQGHSRSPAAFCGIRRRRTFDICTSHRHTYFLSADSEIPGWYQIRSSPQRNLPEDFPAGKSRYNRNRMDRYFRLLPQPAGTDTFRGFRSPLEFQRPAG